MGQTLFSSEVSYRQKLKEYTNLSKKEGTAYGFYACATVLMPNCVTALVLFYGGKLVVEGEISSGKLVSFLLYLGSLSDAFNSMGGIFSALTSALGAADKGESQQRDKLSKRSHLCDNVFSPLPPSFPRAAISVFEMIKREPKITLRPEAGLAPEECTGCLELRNVTFRWVCQSRWRFS